MGTSKRRRRRGGNWRRRCCRTERNSVSLSTGSLTQTHSLLTSPSMLEAKLGLELDLWIKKVLKIFRTFF